MAGSPVPADRYAAAAVECVRGAIGDVPSIAVVLGSGLGAFADTLADAVVLPYERIPSWPAPGVAGHPGRMVAGSCRGRRVIALAGRTHLYEGGGGDAVVFAVRVLAALGVRTLILTNAAGGIAPAFAPGDLMLIDDHLNLTGSNPLVGPNDGRFGPRFPDMSDVYSRRLRDLAREAAAEVGLSLQHGVYAGVLGPSYETPAEIRALAALGADAVGMSTVHEAIAARHAGLEVLGLSCISNLAAGRLPQPLSEAEVLETTRRVAEEVRGLLEGIIGRL